MPDVEPIAGVSGVLWPVYFVRFNQFIMSSAGIFCLLRL